jgi:hypothetical protein
MAERQSGLVLTSAKIAAGIVPTALSMTSFRPIGTKLTLKRTIAFTAKEITVSGRCVNFVKLSSSV